MKKLTKCLLAVGCIATVLGVGYVIYLVSSNAVALQVAGLVATLLGAVAAVIQIALHRRDKAAATPDHDRHLDAHAPSHAVGASIDKEESRAAIAAETLKKRKQALDDHAPVFIELTAESTFDAESTVAQGYANRPNPAPIGRVTEIAERSPRTVLLGEPGAGKSTCLWEITRRAAERVSEGGPLPLFVPLADWEDPAQSAVDFLREQFIRQHGPANFYSQAFETHLTNGSFLLLLDGLNEVPGRAARSRDHVGGHVAELSDKPQQTASKVVESFGRGATDARERSLRKLVNDDESSSRIVVTCRTHEYDETFAGTSKKWTSVEITPMTHGQIEHFVRERRPADTDEVLAILEDNEGLAGLTGNPFLLNSIVELKLDALRDVSGKANLMDHLLSESIAKAAVDEREEMTKAAPHLGAVAYRMVRNWRIGNQAPLTIRSEEERRAAKVLASTPLVVDRDGSYYFQHQIVQEYFAARWLANRPRARRPVRLLVDRRWSEIIVFWIQLDERKRAGRLTRRCLRARNLPWRRPRRSGSVAVMALSMVVGTFVLVFLGALALTLSFGSARAFPAPTAWLGLSPLTVIVGLLVASVLANSLSVHGGIASNAAYSLAVAGEIPELRHIVRSFRTTNQKERSDVAMSLGSTGLPVLEHAEHGLRSRNWRVRAGSVLALAAVAEKSPETLEDIRPLLRGAAECDDPRLVISTVTALVKAGDDQLECHVGPLLTTVEQMSPFVVGLRFLPLVTMVNPTAVEWSPAVLASFRRSLDSDRNVPVLLAIISAVDALHVPDMEAALTRLIEAGPAGAVMLAAARALGNSSAPVAGENLVSLASAARVPKEVTAAGVRRLKAEHHLPVLVVLGSHGDHLIRAAAATALGTSSDARALDTLQQLLEDPFGSVRAAAIEALHDHETVLLDVFAEIVSDGEKDVRKAALDAICARPNLARLREVKRVVENPTHPERLAATRALADFGPAAERPLRDMTGALDRKVRRAATRGLRQLKWEQQRGGTKLTRTSRIDKVRATFAVRRQELRRLALEERVAGAQAPEMMQRLQAKILQDGELKRRFRALLSAAVGALFAAMFVLVVVSMAICRIGVLLGVWALDHKLLTLAFVGATIIGYLLDEHASRAALETPGHLVFLAGTSFVALVVIGTIFYFWWIPLAVLIVFGVVMTLWSTVRSRRKRIRRVDEPARCEIVVDADDQPVERPRLELIAGDGVGETADSRADDPDEPAAAGSRGAPTSG